MKKILILIFICIIVVVSGTILVSKKHWKEKAKTEVKDDFLAIPEYTTNITTTSSYDDGYSYWFIVVEEKDGSLKLNTFVKQNHKYFSAVEAKAEFKKDVFILNIVEVSKETYDHNNHE